MSEEINTTTDTKTGGEDENKKTAAHPLDSAYMKKSDVTALANRSKELAKKAVSDITKLHLGQGYSDAEDSVLAFTDELLFGTMYDYHNMNTWFKSIQPQDIQKLVNTDCGQTLDDLRAAFEAWHLIDKKVEEQMNTVYHYIQEVISGDLLRQAYIVMREDMIVRNEHYSDIISSLDFIFEEYDKILEKYKRASIFDEIPAKKANGYDVNYKLVVDHMLLDFKKSSHAGDIIHDTLSYPDPYWFNYFTVLDGDTRRLSRLPEVSKFADEITKIAALDNEITGYLKDRGLCFTVLSEAIHDVLDFIRFTFREARDILINYRGNTQEFPYNIMHYSYYVKKVGDSLMSLKDPATNGTQYVDLAWAMMRRCEQLAATVAKQAP